MFKKIAVISLASLVLGGCSLASLTKTDTAVSDQKPGDAMMATSTPAPVVSPSPDPELQAIPSNGTGNDDKTLETDINNTTILDENFSDIK